MNSIQIPDGNEGLELVKEDPLVKQWIKGSEFSEKTIPGYLLGLRFYCRYTDKMPSELIDEAEKEIMDGIPMRRRKIKRYLAGFKEYLIEDSLKRRGREPAPKTIHGYKAAVRSFYTYHEIPLPNSIKNSTAKPLRENRRQLTKDIVEKALKFMDLRGRAIILTKLSSGISDTTLRNLKVRDFRQGYDSETGITTLELRRSKTGIDFITFMTPEASQAVKDYLGYRNRKPDLEKHNGSVKRRYKRAFEKRKIRSPDDYLFIHNFISEDYLDDYDDEKRKMTHESLQSIFRRLNDKVGLDKGRKKHQWGLLRGHNIRKLFSTILRNEGADHFMIEFWMGHQIPEQQKAYFFASPEKIRKIYMKYMKHLMIQPSETKVLETDEYKELKERNEELKKELEELKDSKEQQLGAAVDRLLEQPEIRDRILDAMQDIAEEAAAKKSA